MSDEPPKKIIISRYWVYAGLAIAFVVAMSIVCTAIWMILSYRFG
jgi:hypothetical protein